MTQDKGILIKNIYIMLSYAFQELRHNNYEKIEKQSFDNIMDLLAEILYLGVSKQLKHGLHRDYISHDESLTTIRGKINMPKTIRNMMCRKRLIGCEFDELSENNIFNRILKTTLSMLIKENSVKQEKRYKLQKIMPFFSNVDITNPHLIEWKNLTYRRNNVSYEMLMNLCYFVIEGLLLTTDTGYYNMETFTEKNMPKLFEHFVLNYYRRNHSELHVGADKIPWNISEEENQVIHFLPNMQSDIMLQYKDRTVIIDTKYYSKALIQNRNKDEVRSSHMYQIYSYVKNYDIHHSGNVSGILLYAKTDEDVSPNLDAIFDGNRISVHTLDLNCDFKDIAKQLDGIADEYLK